jgi:muramoyltetrapeptide carboxypeptidase
LRTQGFLVEEGRCLRSQTQDASAPADVRAAELMHFLLRDDIDAIFPPWGGELAIELLHPLDWAALSNAKPKWLIGYSDSSTWMLPMTLRLGWATVHGPCLMDWVPGQDDPLTRSALSHLATPTGGRFVQHASTHWQKQWTDFAIEPGCTYKLTEPTRWHELRGHDHAQFAGRIEQWLA